MHPRRPQDAPNWPLDRPRATLICKNKYNTKVSIGNLFECMKIILSFIVAVLVPEGRVLGKTVAKNRTRFWSEGNFNI